MNKRPRQLFLKGGMCRHFDLLPTMSSTGRGGWGGGGAGSSPIEESGESCSEAFDFTSFAAKK